MSLRSCIVAALVVAGSGCAPTPKAEAPAGSVVLTPCREPGVLGELRCGSFEVVEDPDAPDGRRIALRIVVAPAHERAEPDPVFFLAGGPGQGATETMGIALGFLDRARKHRDIVFVDIRGTGGSNKLPCAAPAGDLAARLEFESEPELLADCLAGYDADPRHYNTPRFVADLEAVRAAMGYDAVNLYGGSYGTRLGLAYMAQHGDRVRSAVLDGLAPYAMTLFVSFGADGKVALDRMFADCAAQPACADAFPDLEARFWAWLNGLTPAEGEEPVRVTLRDPRTGGRALDVPLERVAVASAVRGLLYSPEYAALLPFAMHSAIAGDVQPLVGQALILGEGAENSMAVGLMLSTACAEDLPRVTAEQRAELEREPFLGAAMVDMMSEACAAWPAGDVPDSLFEPVASDVPVLLLSGAEDPVTPERWAAEAGTTLTDARSLTVPNTGHIAAAAGCVDKVVRDFFEDPAEDPNLDRRCVAEVKRPPFFLRSTGPDP